MCLRNFYYHTTNHSITSTIHICRCHAHHQSFEWVNVTYCIKTLLSHCWYSIIFDNSQFAHKHFYWITIVFSQFPCFSCITCTYTLAFDYISKSFVTVSRIFSFFLHFFLLFPFLFTSVCHHLETTTFNSSHWKKEIICMPVTYSKILDVTILYMVIRNITQNKHNEHKSILILRFAFEKVWKLYWETQATKKKLNLVDNFYQDRSVFFSLSPLYAFTCSMDVWENEEGIKVK